MCVWCQEMFTGIALWSHNYNQQCNYSTSVFSLAQNCGLFQILSRSKPISSLTRESYCNGTMQILNPSLIHSQSVSCSGSLYYILGSLKGKGGKGEGFRDPVIILTDLTCMLCLVLDNAYNIKERVGSFFFFHLYLGSHSCRHKLKVLNKPH